jgi:tetratricopeptide (TPR) repeat protein
VYHAVAGGDHRWSGVKKEIQEWGVLQDLLDEAAKLTDQGMLDRAVDRLREAEERFRTCGVDELYARFLLQMGDILILRNNWPEAWDCFDRALVFIESQIGKEDDSDFWRNAACRTLLGMGKVAFRQSDYPTAKDLLKQCTERKGCDPDTEGKAFIETANIFAEEGVMDKAITNYLKAIEVLEEVGDDMELSRACNNIADAYNKVDMRPQAFEYAKQSVEYGKKAGSLRSVAFAGMNAASALLHQGDIDGARDYYEISHESLGDSPDPYGQGALINLLGMIETRAGNYDEARDAFERARDLLEESGIRFYLARTYHEYGRMFALSGEPSNARQYLKMALEIYEGDECGKEAQKVRKDLDGLVGD